MCLVQSSTQSIIENYLVAFGVNKSYTEFLQFSILSISCERPQMNPIS